MIRREYIEHHRLRSIVQAVIDREKGVETFGDYMKEAFPWIETDKKRDRESHVKILQDEVKRGGLRVTPLEQPSIRSRLKGRVKTISAEEAYNRGPTRNLKSLSAKLGVPIR